jgi:hypothetical protein
VTYIKFKKGLIPGPFLSFLPPVPDLLHFVTLYAIFYA